MENIVELQSQQELAQKIIRKLSGEAPVVLLCGKEGSGRSTVCHLVADLADDKMQVIFLPCTPSLSRENLRELILQQLFPDKNLSCSLPLTETLSKTDFTAVKALIIADDIDDVPLDLLREINTLVGNVAPQLSFLGVCDEQSAKAAGEVFNVEPVSVLPLDYRECIFLCREYLAQQNKMEVFEGHWDKLPTLFKSKLYTPALVFAAVDGFDAKDVIKSGRERFNNDKAGDKYAESSAKSGSKWPYILLLLLLLASGAYYFLSKDAPDDTVVSDNTPKEAQVPEVIVDTGALGANIPEGINVEAKEDKLQNELVISGEALEKIEESATNKNSGSAASTLQIAPAITSEKNKSAVTYPDKLHQNAADGKKDTDAVNAAKSSVSGTNNADLKQDTVPEALRDVNGVNTDKDGVISLTFADSEPGAADKEESAVVPGQKLDKSDGIAAESEPEPAKAANASSSSGVSSGAKSDSVNPLVSGTDSVDKKPEVCPEQVEEPGAQIKSPKLREQNVNPGDVSSVKPQEKAYEAKPAGSSQTAHKSTVKQRVYSDKTLRFDRIPFTGEAIPGSVSEIAFKDNSHYTIQVVSAYSRVRAVEVSAGVKGRYWIYETVRNNRPWYVLISGDYATADEARSAVNNLPRALMASGPFVKKFSQVKFEMDKKQ